MRAFARGALALAAALYPLWAWWGLSRWGLSSVALLLALLAALRFALLPSRRTVAAALLAAALALLSLFCGTSAPLLWYPVAVNAGLLFIFASSLSSTPVVERIARLRDRNLPEAAVRWCRRTTAAWCVFFTANGVIALATVLSGDMELWALWNGCLSYAAVGLMLAGEWILRRRAMKRGRLP